MRWLDRLNLRLRTLFRRKQTESELHRELEFHLQEQIAENMAKGMPAEQARYSALCTIGGITQIQEQCRDQRGLHWIETTMQDVRYSLRSLRKSPGFTLVAILSLALGTGANTAIFSLIDSILLNSLPVKDPQQLVFVHTNRTKVGNFMVSRTLFNRDLDRMQQQATEFEGIASTQRGERLNLAVDGRAELTPGDFVFGTYFQRPRGQCGTWQDYHAGGRFPNWERRGRKLAGDDQLWPLAAPVRKGCEHYRKAGRD